VITYGKATPSKQVIIIIPASQCSYKLFEITSILGQRIVGIYNQPKQPASSLHLAYEDQLVMFPKSHPKLNGNEVDESAMTEHTRIARVFFDLITLVEVGESYPNYNALRITQGDDLLIASLATACERYPCEGVIFDMKLPRNPTLQELAKYKVDPNCQA